MYIITETCDRECAGHYFARDQQAATDKANELLAAHCKNIGCEDDFRACAKKPADGVWPPAMQMADPAEGATGAWCNLRDLKWDAHVAYVPDNIILDTMFQRPDAVPVSMKTSMTSDTPDAQDILESMAARQRMNDGKLQTCPRCGCQTVKPGLHRNAMSRHARIYICDACGGHEAVLAQTGTRWPFTAWAASKPDFRVEAGPEYNT